MKKYTFIIGIIAVVCFILIGLGIYFIMEPSHHPDVKVGDAYNQDLTPSAANNNYIIIDGISSTPPNTKPQFSVGEVLEYTESASKVASGKKFNANLSTDKIIINSKVEIKEIKRFEGHDCYVIVSYSPSLPSGSSSVCVDKDNGEILSNGEIKVYAPWMLRLKEGIKWTENITYLPSGILTKNEYVVEGIENINQRKCFKVTMKTITKSKNGENWHTESLTFLWIDVNDRIIIKKQFCTPDNVCIYEINLKSIKK